MIPFSNHRDTENLLKNLGAFVSPWLAFINLNQYLLSLDGLALFYK